MLDPGETWTYLATGQWAPGLNPDTATATDSFTDDATHTQPLSMSDDASYTGVTAGVTIDKQISVDGIHWLDMGVGTLDSLDLLVGSTAYYRAIVTNTGGLSETVGVTDVPAATVKFAGNATVTLAAGDHATSDTWTETVVAGTQTDTATATATTAKDDCGDTATVLASDSAQYTGHAVTLPGLTKGYWATHLTLWDVYSGDEKGAGSEINVAGKYDWNKDLSISNVGQSDLTSNGSSSSLGLVKTTSKDSGLLMGDLNHDGLANDGHADLFFDLTSAQLLANNSVSGDARIILASQAVAAQLNDYNDYLYDQAHGGLTSGFTASPNGLIEDAVLWLTGDTTFGLSANGHSNVDTNTANDAGLPAKTVISDTAGKDYTVTSGVVTLGGTALSSSDASWSTFASTPVFTDNGTNGIFSHPSGLTSMRTAKGSRTHWKPIIRRSSWYPQTVRRSAGLARPIPITTIRARSGESSPIKASAASTGGPSRP
jgi:hypothetical protein